MDINNKQFMAMMHPELGIFSMASTEVQSAPPPEARELPVRQERGRQMSRENSRSMPVD